MVLNKLSKFPCEVEGAGYVRIKSSKDEEAYIVVNDASPEGVSKRSVRVYDPLSVETLFLLFAHTPTSDSAILGFCNQYGFLDAKREDFRIGESEALSGESLSTWVREITKLKKAVDVWLAVQGDNKKFLSEEILLNSIDGAFLASVAGETPWLVHPQEAYYKEYKKGNYKPLALKFLQRVINRQLESGISPTIGWKDDQKNALEIALVPTSLHKAVWVQFAYAIRDDKRFRKCAECGIWFNLPKIRGRSDRIYCSNSCKVKAYKQRKEQVQKLYQENVSVQDIAKKLKLDNSQVKKWVEEL